MTKHFLFLINSIVATALIVLFGLSFVPPSKVPILPAITLLTPIFIAINMFFLMYWLVKLNKKFLLSFICLLICFSFFSSFCQLGFGRKEVPKGKEKLKVLSFNTYGFRKLNAEGNFKKEFVNFIEEEQPDILFLQEVNLFTLKKMLPQYKYSQGVAIPTGYGTFREEIPIFSKYPIINYEVIEASNKDLRRTFYADIKVKNDTIRCYNAHLTSYRYTKDLEKLKERGTKNIVKRANSVFKYQEQQVEHLTEHLKTSPYPVIFCGDFNNMAFSYIHRELKNSGNLNDTFTEAGKGFGATIEFPFFPTRIDFILVEENIEVYNHRVKRTKEWSDHYPIIVEIALPINQQ